MDLKEARRIAQALQRKNFPASSYDSGSNFGYGVLNYDTNDLYFNPWSMPTEWVAVYRRMIARQTKEN